MEEFFLKKHSNLEFKNKTEQSGHFHSQQANTFDTYLKRSKEGFVHFYLN